VEVRIGVRDVAREISFESAQSATEVQDQVTAALDGGSVLALTDDKGRVVVVPVAALGYVHIGEQAKGRVGFATQ
jgi:hypothetical protein